MVSGSKIDNEIGIRFYDKARNTMIITLPGKYDPVSHTEAHAIKAKVLPPRLVLKCISALNNMTLL